MMMGGGQVPNPKKLDREDRVQSITHCGDSYQVSTADGKVRDFLERNLRVKTDVSDEGPQKGALYLCANKSAGGSCADLQGPIPAPRDDVNAAKSADMSERSEV